MFRFPVLKPLLILLVKSKAITSKCELQFASLDSSSYVKEMSL